MNVLTDVPWIHTNRGQLAPREALTRASDITLDTSRAGFEIGAQIRTLMAFYAVAQKLGNIDRAIDAIGKAADLRNFMQQPGSPQGVAPLRVLSPTVSPDKAADFWNLSTRSTYRMQPPEAALALAVYWHYSLVSNARIERRKGTMSAPGFHYPGSERSATEYIRNWGSLSHVFKTNTPREWIDLPGLPAWADHQPAETNPLWRCTWAGNAPQCQWSGTILTGAVIGGVPEEWCLPEQGVGDERKAWTKARNLDDPLYLYVEGKQQRCDAGKIESQLAVDWASRRLTDRLGNEPVLVLRHRVEGTATAPSIRVSEAVLIGEQCLSPEVAELVNRAHWALTEKFRTPTMGDKAKNRVLLDALAGLQSTVSRQYWRAIELLLPVVSDDAVKQIAQVTLSVYDEATEPFGFPERVAYVRGRISSALYHPKEEENVSSK